MTEPLDREEEALQVIGSVEWTDPVPHVWYQLLALRAHTRQIRELSLLVEELRQKVEALEHINDIREGEER